MCNRKIQTTVLTFEAAFRIVTQTSEVELRLCQFSILQQGCPGSLPTKVFALEGYEWHQLLRPRSVVFMQRCKGCSLDQYLSHFNVQNLDLATWDGQHYVFNNVNLQIRHNVTLKRQSLFASKVCSVVYLCREMFLHNMLTLITLQDAITLVVIEQNNLVSL